MPFAVSEDGVKLHYQEVDSGTALLSGARCHSPA